MFVADYEDEAFSAYSRDRGPGLVDATQHAEDLAVEHGIAELWVQHSDRIARGDGKAARHTVEIALWALKHDVRVRTLQDPETFRDLLYAVVTGQRNNEDSKRKGLSSSAGRRRAAARGQYIGYLLDGYKIEVDSDGQGNVSKRMVLDPERQELIALIFRLAHVRSDRKERQRRRLADKTSASERHPAQLHHRQGQRHAEEPALRRACLLERRGRARGHWPAYITERQSKRIGQRLRQRRAPKHYRQLETYLLAKLSKGSGVKYAHDAANDPTTIGSETYSYDAASELEKRVLGKSTVATYGYDELGERTKTTAATGPATTYGYDQAGNLTSVERAVEGEKAAIKDTYAYDGDGLRASQTISGATSYMSWDAAEALPLLLNDGTSSFVYGPGGLPLEQVTGETVQYLHHDQQGSTRLLTSASGAVAATTTFDAYGNKLGSTGSATSALGYDGQYTSSDTGLIYLRARVYDPATAQFISADPAVAFTWEPYSFAFNNPLRWGDWGGLDAVALPLEGSDAAACLTPETIGPCAVVGVGGYLAVEAASSIVDAWAGEEAGNDEGHAFLEQRQAEEAAEERAGDCPPEPSQSLPYRGAPNSTGVLDRGNGSGQIRDYGPDGLPLRDFDFGHDHGFGDPHVHDWPDGERGPGRPLEPGE
jgi:RHS repeat-associated protein